MRNDRLFQNLFLLSLDLLHSSLFLEHIF